jgi:hypothetical protein
MIRKIVVITLILFCSACAGPVINKSDLQLSSLSKKSKLSIYSRLVETEPGKYDLKDTCFISSRNLSTCPSRSYLENSSNGYVDLGSFIPVYDISTIDCNAVGWNPSNRCIHPNEFFQTSLNSGMTFGSWLLIIPIFVGNSWHFVAFDEDKFKGAVDQVKSQMDIEKIVFFQEKAEEEQFQRRVKDIALSEERRLRAEEAEKSRITSLATQISNFRTGLDVGDDSNCGLVIEVKKPVVKVQTSQGEHWLKIEELYPYGSADCFFINGQYIHSRPRGL